MNLTSLFFGSLLPIDGGELRACPGLDPGWGCPHFNSLRSTSILASPIEGEGIDLQELLFETKSPCRSPRLSRFHIISVAKLTFATALPSRQQDPFDKDGTTLRILLRPAILSVGSRRSRTRPKPAETYRRDLCRLRGGPSSSADRPR